MHAGRAPDAGYFAMGPECASRTYMNVSLPLSLTTEGSNHLAVLCVPLINFQEPAGPLSLLHCAQTLEADNASDLTKRCIICTAHCGRLCQVAIELDDHHLPHCTQSGLDLAGQAYFVDASHHYSRLCLIGLAL